MEIRLSTWPGNARFRHPGEWTNMRQAAQFSSDYGHVEYLYAILHRGIELAP